MCGIAGILSLNKNTTTLQNIKKMTDSIVHRGPDGEGHWIDSEQIVALGHRRLSILDLSEAGAQPMHYLDRYCIVFNGEIYNYLEIREQLLKKGYHFRSNSDTEVLMALFDSKRAACLDDLDGMFAFAIWDKQEQTLFCARDRFGEKPFYYKHTANSEFIFASEMKALWSIGVPKETNNRMLFNYWFFDYLYNPANLAETFYQNIFSLEPAHYIILDKNVKIIAHKKYWDIDYTRQDDSISLETAKETFKDLFYTSIQRRLRSDVPVGSSLSGGLDSSSIVCALNQIKEKDTIQKTFSARFPSFLKDESKFIDIVLKNTSAEGFSCYPSAEGMNEVIDKVIYHQEEPFGSLSILAQYDVMKLAKEHNTVVLLDGQGADEILCGYHGLVDSFFFELKQKDKKQYDDQIKMYRNVHQHNKINSVSRRFRNKLIKDYLTSKQIDKLLGIRTYISEKFDASVKKDFFESYRKEQFSKNYKADSLNEMLYQTTMCGSLQELLRYADRNSMAHAREMRLPFLSHELVEFVFRMPATFKVNQGYTKYLLRTSMASILPEEITWRKDKIGFETPANHINLNNKFELKDNFFFCHNDLEQYKTKFKNKISFILGNQLVK